ARAVAHIVEISDAGRAPKNDPALFALAMACAMRSLAAGTPNVDQTVQLAMAALPAVARIGTHLFTFCEYVSQFRGWGRGLRTAVGRWYTQKTADELAYQCAKYQGRGGWTHRDVLRSCHATSQDPALYAVLRWVANGAERMGPLQVKRKMEGG